jgi:hypothetical protein
MLISAAVVFSARETIRPQPAAAESHKRVHGTHGKGYVIDGQWIGTWHTQDGTGFCIEFDKDHPDSTGAGQLGGRVPGMSTTTDVPTRRSTAPRPRSLSGRPRTPGGSTPTTRSC